MEETSVPCDTTPGYDDVAGNVHTKRGADMRYATKTYLVRRQYPNIASYD
jgi:hypothetical protein